MKYEIKCRCFSGDPDVENTVMADIKLLAEAIKEQTLSTVANVQAVSFKAPSFWTTNAAAWFTRLEAAFATHHPPITNDLLQKVKLTY